MIVLLVICKKYIGILTFNYFLLDRFLLFSYFGRLYSFSPEFLNVFNVIIIDLLLIGFIWNKSYTIKLPLNWRGSSIWSLIIISKVLCTFYFSVQWFFLWLFIISRSQIIVFNNHIQWWSANNSRLIRWNLNTWSMSIVTLIWFNKLRNHLDILRLVCLDIIIRCVNYILIPYQTLSSFLVLYHLGNIS